MLLAIVNKVLRHLCNEAVVLMSCFSVDSINYLPAKGSADTLLTNVLLVQAWLHFLTITAIRKGVLFIWSTSIPAGLKAPLVLYVSKPGAGLSTCQNTDRLAIVWIDMCLFWLLFMTPHDFKMLLFGRKVVCHLLTNHLTWPSSVFLVHFSCADFFSNVKSTKHFLQVENVIFNVFL